MDTEGTTRVDNDLVLHLECGTGTRTFEEFQVFQLPKPGHGPGLSGASQTLLIPITVAQTTC